MWIQIIDYDIATKETIHEEPIKTHMNDFPMFLNRFFNRFPFFDEDYDAEIQITDADILIIVENKQYAAQTKMRIWGLDKDSYPTVAVLIGAFAQFYRKFC